MGLDLNAARDAGFLGARVTLTVQLDDDETPSLTATEECVTRVVGELPPLAVDWLAYYDAPAGTMVNVPGRIADTTGQLARSGTIRFDVPFTFGPIPAGKYRNLRDASATTALDACFALGNTLGSEISALPVANPVKNSEFTTALTHALTAVQAKAGEVEPAIGHPLDPKYRDPAKEKGWLRIRLAAPLTTKHAAPRLRIATFNIAPATNAITVTNELAGSADGRPGQIVTLGNGNVLDGTLELAVQEEPDQPLVTWRAVDSLDAATPNDRVFALDREAGTITFGDGIRGRIPALVPRGGASWPCATASAAGRRGERRRHDHQPGDGARRARRRHQPRRRHRRRGRGDAGRGKDSRAAGALHAEPRGDARRLRVDRAPDADGARRPRADRPAPAAAPRRHAPPRDRHAGVRRAAPRRTGGARHNRGRGRRVGRGRPRRRGAEPVPTPSFLRRVCCHLDKYRLVTTEVHVVPPQYLRICEVVITLLPQPGFTRSRLQALVEARLAAYLHVLTGGHAGTGYPFGGQVHVADLIAQVFRVEGVERVESLAARFTHTKSNVALRQGRLTLCPSTTDETDEVQLGPEESVSLMPGSVTVSTVV